MDIKVQVLKAHSKENAKLIAEYVLQRNEGFKVLINLLQDEDPEVTRRAAWPFGIAGHEKPEMLLPYLPETIFILESRPHPALSRNLYRILQELNIPADYQGLIFDLAVAEIANPKTPSAIRAFAMSTACNIACSEKALIPELQLTIEGHWENAPKAYLSRGRKILKKLEKAYSE